MLSYQCEDGFELVGQLLVHDEVAIEAVELDLCGGGHFLLVHWGLMQGSSVCYDWDASKIVELVWSYLEVELQEDERHGRSTYDRRRALHPPVHALGNAPGTHHPAMDTASHCPVPKIEHELDT